MIHYPQMLPGIFLRRPNRFIAHVEIGGTEQICHVKNTGRCRELLVPGAEVWCQHHDSPVRKTAYSLITVNKGGRRINLDSQVPNRIAFQWVQEGGLGFVPRYLKPEKTYKNSRFDLYLEDDRGRPGFVEVKGVTLEKDNIAYFPDAPTQRGTKHLHELAEAAGEGYLAYLLFIVQMEDILQVEPNRQTDPRFALALTRAGEAGVQIRAVGCRVTESTIETDAPIPVLWTKKEDDL